MIKYYGTPLSPVKIFNEALTGRNVLIPYPRPDNLQRTLKICNKVIVDNGAFTLWKKGGTIDWDKYYLWLQSFIDKIEFFFIPDVIDGTEKENDHLIAEYFKGGYSKGVPIWHINESLERLIKLMNSFDYIAIGSAGEFSQLGTHKWHIRMDEAMRVLCDKDGYPKVKIHMLRCLDARLFTKYPFHSGDSTSLAVNHKKYSWQSITSRIEKYNSPLFYTFKNYYKTESLFLGENK